MFERFTDRARRVVVLAQEEARMLNHNYIGTEHILLGLIHEGTGSPARRWRASASSLDNVREQVQEIIGQGQQAPSGHIPSPAGQEGPRLSLREALQLGHNLHRHRAHPPRPHPEGRGRRCAGARQARRRPRKVPPTGHPADLRLPGQESQAAGVGPPASSRRASRAGSLVLDQFGRNLTQAAREPKLDPVIGREKEIERVMQVLAPDKNNPVLIGEPGVSKTAVVEGWPGHRAR